MPFGWRTELLRSLFQLNFPYLIDRLRFYKFRLKLLYCSAYFPIIVKDVISITHLLYRCISRLMMSLICLAGRRITNWMFPIGGLGYLCCRWVRYLFYSFPLSLTFFDTFSSITTLPFCAIEKVIFQCDTAY